MLYRTFITVITLASLLGFTGLSACHRDEPEGAEEAPRQQETPPMSGASPGQEASSPQEQEATPPLAEQQTQPSVPPSTTASDTTSAQLPPSKPLDRLAPASDDVLAELEQEMLARWEKIRSVSAKMTTRFDQLGDRETHQKGLGTYDCLKQDGKILVRTFLYNGITAKRDNEDVPWVLTGQRIKRVSDGRFVYTIDERYKEITGAKRWAVYPNLLYIGGKRLFRVLRSLEGLQRLPDQTIDKKGVYVFQGTLSAARRQARVFLDKETGIMRQLITENEKSESKFVFTLSEIKLDVEFSEDHFIFVPPEDVEIQDLTQQQAGEDQATTEP